MTLAELKTLVAQGEGQYLEFKKKADHPEKIVRELVAFANSGGGTLLLGVNDDGHIPGLRFADEEMYTMEAAIALYARPHLPYQVQRIKVLMGHEVLLYKIPPGSQKPYYWLADKATQQYRAYVRSRDQSLQASREMFQLLKFRPDPARPYTFELKPLEQKLLRYLAAHTSITVKQLAELAKIPMWKASQKMMLWVKQGVLRIEPNAEGDRYFPEAGFEEIAG